MTETKIHNVGRPKGSLNKKTIRKNNQTDGQTSTQWKEKWIFRNLTFSSLLKLLC